MAITVREWLNWRTVMGAIVFGSLLALVLFKSTKTPFALSGLDLFFFLTTVISLGFNIQQVVRDQSKYDPMKHSFIALFNDLKGRQLRAYERRTLITSPSSMSADVEAMRREFFDYVGETIQSLEQLKEHVVGAIKTLDPGITSEQVYRAAEFGLNEQEQRFRKENTERFIQTAVNTPVQPGPPPSGSN